MQFKFKVSGLNELNSFAVKLPKEMENKLSESNERFALQVKETARKMAPKDTGELKSSIQMVPVKSGKNVKKWQVIADAPHAMFQEEGFSPHPFLVDPGRPGFKTRKLRHLYGKVIHVRKFTPFMKPAIERNISRFFNSIKLSSRRAIARAGG